MRNFKKLTALVLALSMVFTGCTSAGEGTSSTPEQTPPATVQPEVQQENNKTLTEAGTYTGEFDELVIAAANVILENVKAGKIVISDQAGDGEIKFDNVTVDLLEINGGGDIDAVKSVIKEVIATKDVKIYVDTKDDVVKFETDSTTVIVRKPGKEDSEAEQSNKPSAETPSAQPAAHVHNYKGYKTASETCKKPAVMTYVCQDTSCLHTYTENVGAKLGHDYSVLVENVAANCTDDGKQVYKCSRCESTKTVVLESKATSHVWDAGFVNVEPTCTETGKSIYKCTVCDAEETRETPSLGGHDMQPNVALSKAPTCTDAGEDVKKCTRCTETEITPVPATGHDWKVTATVESTCSAFGTETSTCETCGETSTKQLEKKEHTPVNFPEVPATCVATGFTGGTYCSVCNVTLTDRTVLPVSTAHTFPEGNNYSKDSSGHWKVCTVCQVATSTVEGHNYPTVDDCAAVINCAACGYEKPQDEHAWSGWTVTNENGVSKHEKHCQICEAEGSVVTENCNEATSIDPIAATCLAAGSKDGKKCSVCGTVTKEPTVVDALGHKWTDSGEGAGWVTDMSEGEDVGTHTRSCKRDGCNVSETKEHTNWTEVSRTNPTCTTDGVINYTCNDCGAAKQESITKLGHKFEGDYAPVDGNYHSRQCVNVCNEVRCEAVEEKNHSVVDGECTVCHTYIVTIGEGAEAQNITAVDVTADQLTGTTITNFKLKCSSEDKGKHFNDITTFYIVNGEGLFNLRDVVNVQKNSLSGKVIKLGCNVDLKGELWTPIGQTGDTQLLGEFDGNGKTISNLNVNYTDTSDNRAAGLFGWVEGGNIKNFTVNTATVRGHHNVGVIAGYLADKNTTITNCHVINATVINTHANGSACGDKTGGIVGYMNSNNIVQDCTVTNSTITVDGRDAGQVVGAGHTAKVINCSATNVIVQEVEADQKTCDDGSAGKNIRNEVIGRVLS